MSSKTKKKYRQEKDIQVAKAKIIKSIKTLINKGMTSKALSEVERYLEIYPNDSYGLFQRAKINRMLDNHERAKEDLEYIIENGLESKHSAMYELSNYILIEGDIDKAEKMLIENIETSPYPEIYSIVFLSNIKLIKGEKEEALNVIYKYGDLNEDEIVIQQAVIMNKFGDTVAAYNLLKNHTFSNDVRILTKYYDVLGNFSSIMGNYEEAKENYEKLFSIVSIHQLDRAEVNYAACNYHMGDWETARKLCLKVLYNSNSDYKEKACFILGNICRDEQNYEEARGYYLESINHKLFPIYRGYSYVAETYSLEENYDKAIEFYKKAISKSENAQVISSAYLRLAYIAFRDNDIDSISKNLDCINKNSLTADEISDYVTLKIFLEYKDGINSHKDIYIYSQFEDYSYDKLVKHIDKQHSGNGVTTIFSENLDLNSFVLEIQEEINKTKPVKNFTFDKYHIKYNNVGYVNGESIDYCEVIVLPNTKKIITIYPYRGTTMRKKELQEKRPQKKMTRIEKFNQKYGLKSDK